MTTDYIYGKDGRVLAEMYPNWGVGYVYSGKRLLSEYTNGTTYFITQDQLGSSSMSSRPPAV